MKELLLLCQRGRDDLCKVPRININNAAKSHVRAGGQSWSQL